MTFKISSEKIEEFIEEQHSIDGMISMHDFELWLEEQPRVGEWIPCSDCLPDDHGTRLVTLSNGTVEGAYYSNDNWWCMSDNTELEVRTNEIIAWMPLPEPYEEGESS